MCKEEEKSAHVRVISHFVFVKTFAQDAENGNYEARDVGPSIANM